ncbi:MAG: hypothetical protein JWR63_3260, partial [Conexibacter sp.]|nr:hypothetical protein [Conexibacter sp.]
RVTRRTLALAAVATALPVAVGATVVVLSHDRPAPEAPITAPLGAGPGGRAIDRSPLPHPPTSLLAAYGRLRQDPTSEDRDNAAVRAYAAKARTFGLDAGAARVLTHRDGKRLWLIPGNGFVCLGLQTLGTPELGATCNTEAAALREGLQNGDGEAIYGVLPDGIDRIEVTDDNGFRHVEPVDHNAYVLRNANATVRYPVGRDRIETFRVIGSRPSPSG